jgi:transcriptional regulator with XRE-family HTH domain
MPFILRSAQGSKTIGPKRLELPKEELAFNAGVSRKYVSLLELNEKSPTVNTLIRLCKAMGTSAGKIVARVEEAS